MPTPSYETPDLRKWNTYRRFLRSGSAKPILDAYSRAGGDAGHLRRKLWSGLQEPTYPSVVPDLSTLQAMRRLLHGLEAISDMRRLEDIDPELWSQLNSLAEIKPVLRTYLDYLRVLPITQRKLLAPFRSMARKAGVKFEEVIPQVLKSLPRGRGHARKTLLAAALVEEFKHRKITSAYRKAATLLYEASPKLFPNLTGEEKADRLGRLVRSVPENIRKREHVRLFPSSLSF